MSALALEISQQVLNGLVIGSVYVLVALGLTVIFGILGIAHFAHGSIAMFGGYAAFWLGQRAGLGLFTAMAAAMPLGALLGIVVERLAYRPVRDAPAINGFIVALGLTLVIDNANLLLFGADQVVIPTPYRRVLVWGPVTVVELRLYVLAACFVLIGALTAFVRWSRLGKAVRAVAQNRDAAILMGVDTDTVSAAVFALGSVLGVAAGVFIGALFAISPAVGEGLVIKGFAILILGGLGSIPGAIVGGFVLGVSETLAAGFISSGYKDVIAFLVMILVLLVRPEGLLGKS